jgi:hypothetical protein
MKLAIELIIYCFVFTVLVRFFAGKSPLDCLYFYPKEVQEKVYELKLSDREEVKKRRKIFLIVFTGIMAVLLVIIIRYVNGVRDFRTAYLQSLLFLEVMNWYDGIMIDRIWVGNDPFWLIEEVREIPYVQTWEQVLKKRGILSLIWLAGSLITAVVIVVL